MPNVLMKKVRFPTSPSELFSIFSDAGELSKASGFRAKGDAQAGTPFTSGNGAFRGTTLYAEQDRLIVQTWRASDWPRDAEDSILIFRFVPVSAGTELHITQSGLPKTGLAELKKRLAEYYWDPIRRYLKARIAAATPPKPRGRPRKPPVDGGTAPKEPKPRGRPRKAPAAAGSAPEPKRRGRPSKSAAVTNGTAGLPPVGTQAKAAAKRRSKSETTGTPAETSAPKRRGRPASKAKAEAKSPAVQPESADKEQKAPKARGRKKKESKA